jgi:pyruvate/2-oxoglutarate dehydrogenase complex dihydrolipoamide acyltransferase (E2) component
MDVKLPKLGEGADSGVVVNVFVKEGDTVAKDQAIMELENEKAVAAIPSTGAGIVEKVYVKAGDRISAGQKIITIADGANAAAAPALVATAAAPKPAAKKIAPKVAPVVEEADDAPVAES